MRMEKERCLLAEYGRRMSSAGLSVGTAGNLSIFDSASGQMAITPSGVDYFSITPEDIVILDLQRRCIEGDKEPSSEVNMHIGFYRAFADVGCHAIVHTHSIYATTLACMGEPIRAVHYAVAGAGTSEIPLCPYATFGTPELAELAVQACVGSRAVSLANHGLVAYGVSIEKAFGLACSLEYVAQLQWQCMSAGKMNVLTNKQISAVLGRFQTYGQKKVSEGDINSY